VQYFNHSKTHYYYSPIIKQSSNVLDVMSVDRAIYEWGVGMRAKNVSFKDHFSRVLKNDRCVALLSSMPSSLVWRGSSLLKKLDEVEHELAFDRPIIESLYSAVKMCATDKESIRRLDLEVNEWTDKDSRPRTPTEGEFSYDWYRSRGFKGYGHYESVGKRHDYGSDGDVEHEGDGGYGDGYDDYY
jgi:hypothetical protein